MKIMSKNPRNRSQKQNTKNKKPNKIRENKNHMNKFMKVSNPRQLNSNNSIKEVKRKIRLKTDKIWNRRSHNSMKRTIQIMLSRVRTRIQIWLKKRWRKLMTMPNNKHRSQEMKSPSMLRNQLIRLHLYPMWPLRRFNLLTIKIRILGIRVGPIKKKMIISLFQSQLGQIMINTKLSRILCPIKTNKEIKKTWIRLSPTLLREIRITRTKKRMEITIDTDRLDLWKWRARID